MFKVTRELVIRLHGFVSQLEGGRIKGQGTSGQNKRQKDTQAET